jgi:hypothetical protein
MGVVRPSKESGGFFIDTSHSFDNLSSHAPKENTTDNDDHDLNNGKYKFSGTTLCNQDEFDYRQWHHYGEH